MQILVNHCTIVIWFFNMISMLWQIPAVLAITLKLMEFSFDLDHCHSNGLDPDCQLQQAWYDSVSPLCKISLKLCIKYWIYWPEDINFMAFFSIFSMTPFDLDLWPSSDLDPTHQLLQGKSHRVSSLCQIWSHCSLKYGQYRPECAYSLAFLWKFLHLTLTFDLQMTLTFDLQMTLTLIVIYSRQG